jgi:pimeloyl-ACP methyl ester carboxylesterase
MWLYYKGLGPDELRAIEAPVLVLAGDRDELIPIDLSVSLYRALPTAGLPVCASLSRDGPTPSAPQSARACSGDFARRHAPT